MNRKKYFKILISIILSVLLVIPLITGLTFKLNWNGHWTPINEPDTHFEFDNSSFAEGKFYKVRDLEEEKIIEKEVDKNLWLIDLDKVQNHFELYDALSFITGLKVDKNKNTPKMEEGKGLIHYWKTDKWNKLVDLESGFFPNLIKNNQVEIQFKYQNKKSVPLQIDNQNAAEKILKGFDEYFKVKNEVSIETANKLKAFDVELKGIDKVLKIPNGLFENKALLDKLIELQEIKNVAGLLDYSSNYATSLSVLTNFPLKSFEGLKELLTFTSDWFDQIWNLGFDESDSNFDNSILRNWSIDKNINYQVSVNGRIATVDDLSIDNIFFNRHKKIPNKLHGQFLYYALANKGQRI